MLILFDLDGTLIDSAPDLAASVNHLRQVRGLAPLPFESLRHFCGAGARGMLAAGLRLTPQSPCYETERQAFLSHYEAHMFDKAALFAGVSDMLRSIEEAGWRWGIVTNKSARFAGPMSRLLGLDGAACLISGSDMGKMKPLPDALLAGIKACGGTAKKTVYIGDDRRDRLCAANAGVPFIAAGWGYVEGSIPVKDWGAEGLAHVPRDVPVLVRRLLS